MPSPAGSAPVAVAAAPDRFAPVKAVFDQRCVVCHNAQVHNKGIELDRPELIRQHAQEVFQQAVVLKQMPLNNATGITDEERDVIRHWYEAGASIR
jgi:uncharacterized membrane protein